MGWGIWGWPGCFDLGQDERTFLGVAGFIAGDRFPGATMAQVMGVMTDNVLQTLQQLIQDVIAPDVRELKVRVSSLEKQLDIRFNALAQTNDGQFKAIMSAIAESKAQSELTTTRMIASLSERVAVLEAKRH